ncbi:nagb/rpia/CoA transferase-like protein [Tilletiaria anomala UBC 951]|uniref:Translation initiation factor eIF2B subunit beta n=1 Tax=Tilletiaria anomala (strain ATCC 24038 / CBS 436.72 / UBC 951) TaxID=1037660 RepID=A0A066V9A8_TILAU|nr:nagb/rpia/CoA transferase-like protein [Tilletiaria anomala UBC 951]KDN35319.1 nagb/rpia/CoA transferase-like protein [Tilletiaria anomala UBC 951]
MPSVQETSFCAVEQVIRDRSTLTVLRNLALQLQRRQLSGPSQVANATAKALRQVVSTSKFQDVEELVHIIRVAGRFLQDAQPGEQTVGNITLRVLHLLREEMKALITPMASNAHSEAPSPTLFSPTSTAPSTPGLSGPSSLIPSLSMLSMAGSSHSAHQKDPFDLLRPSLLSKRSESAFGSSFSISDLIGSAPGSSSACASGIASAIGSAASTDGSRTPGAPTSSQSTSLVGGASALFTRPSASRKGKRRSNDGTMMNFDDDDAEEEEASEDEDEDEDEQDEDEDGEEGGAGEDATMAPSTSASTSTVATKNILAQQGKVRLIAHQIKPLLIQAIQDLLDELETVNSNVARDARDHIHSGELVLTMGRSRTVEAFLKAAAKDRKFTVIVAETAPSYSGHQTARVLSAAGISTILVPDSSIFSMMPRVSKVVIGAHAVLANGGLLGEAGCAMTALAARNQSTPVVVCSGVYKVCPRWEWAVSTGQEGASGGRSAVSAGLGFAHPPASVLMFDDPKLHASVIEETEIVAPMLEYVKPQHVDVYITNVGEFPPSYVYRLIKENYHEEDLGSVEF